jgi:Zn-dependent protease with chaperone function
MSDFSRTYPYSPAPSDSAFTMQMRTAGLPLNLQRIKKASGVGFIVFSLIFIFISQWFLLPTMISGIFRATQTSRVEQDPAILEFLKKEGKIHFNSYRVIHSSKPFAAIGGVPGFPQLFISKALLDTFSTDEMHYVLMHEVGHVTRQHVLREVMLMIAIISMVWSLFAKIHLWQKPRKTQLILACFAGVFLGMVMIQFERIHEYEADYYAIQHLKDPQGMVTAAGKLKEAWGTPERQTIIRELLYRGVPYEARISIANAYSIPKTTIIRPAVTPATPEPLIAAPAVDEYTEQSNASDSSDFYEYTPPTPEATPPSYY